MDITISPAKKIGLMVVLCVLFLATIHFVITPYIQLYETICIPPALRVVLAIAAFVIPFAIFTFAKMYRPLVPGRSSWKQENYWKPLKIEKSITGGVKFTYWVLKIFTFSAVLYGVVVYTMRLYLRNIPQIMNGTWEYDKMEAAFMGAPLIMVFFFFLFLGVKIYDRHKSINIYKNT